MTNVCAESNAFREAQLKSERLRIRIVLGVAGAAILLRVLRTLVVGGHENVTSSLMMCGLVAVFSAYEYFLLRAVNRAIQNGRECGNCGLSLNEEKNVQEPHAAGPSRRNSSRGLPQAFEHERSSAGACASRSAAAHQRHQQRAGWLCRSLQHQYR